MKLVLGLLVVVLAGCDESQVGSAPVPATQSVQAVTVVAPVEVHHIITYGQSLSLGARAVIAFPYNDAIASDYQETGAFMFAGGTRPDDLSALLPYAESITPKDIDSWNLDTPGETPLYGALLTIKGMPGIHIGSTAGRGGTDIYNLRRGTLPYQRLLDQVTAGQNLTKGADTVSIIWMQGESDTQNSNYASEFEQLVMDLDTDVRAITHQGPVQFYVCLPAVPMIAAAQNAAAGAMPQVHIVCDTADLDHSDGLHLTALSSRQAGALVGNEMLRSPEH